VLTSIQVVERPHTSVLRLSLARGSLDPRALVVRDGRIADGAAALELWQGGIRTQTRGLRTGSLAVSVLPRPGRLFVRLRAAKGVFTTLRARQAGGTTILVTLTKRATAKPLPPPPFQPSNQGGVVTTSTQTSTTTQKTVAQKPKQRPKKPTNTGTTSTVTVPSG
jgi:hypothetical protein